MTSVFATAITNTACTHNRVTTSYDPTEEYAGRLGLMVNGFRGINTPRFLNLIREAVREDLVDAFCLVFHIRDCRGGKGERELGRQGLTWLFLNHTDEFMKIACLVGEYGRWDDLLALFPGVLPLEDADFVSKNYVSSVSPSNIPKLQEAQRQIVKIMGDRLKKDKSLMERNEEISFCAKWAPTEGDSLDRKHNTVESLTLSMGITPRTYRKMYITPLRRSLKLVEVDMCAGRWSNVDFSSVPTCAMKRLKNAFAKRCPDRYSEWLSSLSNKNPLNSRTLHPHEILREIRTNGVSVEVCENQWKDILDNTREVSSLKRAIFSVDTSMSMSMNKSTPLDVACATVLIGLNVAQGDFTRNVITFQEHPSFHVIRGEDLPSQYKQIAEIPSDGRANIQAMFDMILHKCENMDGGSVPETLFIISDKHFECSQSSHINFDVIDAKYKDAGIKRPKLVFWNINGSTTGFPVISMDKNYTVISGFSPSFLRFVIGGVDLSPLMVMKAYIEDERYDPVRNALRAS